MSPGRRRRPDLKLHPFNTAASHHASSSNSVKDSVVPVEESLECNKEEVSTITISSRSNSGHSDHSNDRHRTNSAQSATSSLDTYYFSTSSPLQHVPPVPSPGVVSSTTESSLAAVSLSSTPAREEALSMDRRFLVGVGELATPRWTSRESEAGVPWITKTVDERLRNTNDAKGNEFDSDSDEDLPDSPWTIEAIDGETDPEAVAVGVTSQWTRGGSSPTVVSAEPISPNRDFYESSEAVDESGGDEVLYPRRTRTPSSSDLEGAPTSTSFTQPDSNIENKPPQTTDVLQVLESGFSSVSGCNSNELGQLNSVVGPTDTDETNTIGGHPASKERVVRKHRSLVTQGSPGTEKKPRGRRKADSIGLSLSSTLKSKGGQRELHSRHASNESSSSTYELSSGGSGKRHGGPDFSHLPPSPSSSSIQQFLRSPQGVTHAPASSTSVQPKSAGPSTSPKTAAHSLLRGMQEGWSGLDDQATVEVLRKLDGVGGKNVKSRLVTIPGASAKPNSRPGTPGLKPAGSDQWEGIASESVSGRGLSRRVSSASNHATTVQTPLEDSNQSTSSTSTRKSGITVNSTRSSLAAKRSSTLCTTPSSVLAESSVPPANAAPSTKSNLRPRRESIGSDASGLQQELERAANLLVGHALEPGEEPSVPPVPPLPKDVKAIIPGKVAAREPADGQTSEHNDLQPSSLDSSSPQDSHAQASGLDEKDRLLTTQVPLGYKSASPDVASLSSPIAEPSAPLPATKTPSRKWSFSNALHLRLGVSPGAAFANDQKQVSPQSSSLSLNATLANTTDGLERRKSTLPWLSQEDAMSSAGSLCSSSSVSTSEHLRASSSRIDGSPDYSPTQANATSDASIARKTELTSTSPAPRRSSSTKRLTPSAIPFFRRSSSQMMSVPNAGRRTASPISGGASSEILQSSRSSEDPTPPTTAGRKGSMLSLGLPNLLKSSTSRRNVQADRDHSRDKGESLHKGQKLDQGKEKRDPPEVSKVSDTPKSGRKDKIDKDRSESRISLLMGRRRGQTVSSTDSQKQKPVDSLPPIHVPVISSVTVQRVANMKEESSSSSSSMSTPLKTTSHGLSRVNSGTISSMAKQSETTGRSRANLPTIVGSPSVSSKESSSLPNSSTIHGSMTSKDGPTKIPRISSGILAGSPQPNVKTQATISSVRRASLNLASVSEKGSSEVTGTNPGEFGVLTSHNLNSGSRARQSPHLPGAKVARQGSVISTHSTTSTSITHKPKRDSISLSGTRKVLTASSSTGASTQQTAPQTQSRFAALSPSKSLKFLTPKSSLPSARLSANASQMLSGRQASSSPVPATTPIDDDELAADEEMRAWMKRQQAKRVSNPLKKEEIDELLRVPETFAAKSPILPADVLDSPETDLLSEYEKQEILSHDSIYHYGARSNKKQATLENTTNNHGYDDDRGDYIVVTGDHLAYRYEIVDTLGKGSFGQVLRCRDHQTGESVAIKIIRNKKRFHHQALVEIKILDNLRKWDPDEKHHVLKMTEYFYFRNHLCIATELLSINLYELIKANGFVGFTTTLIRRFTAQLLASLSLMRHHRIVHCDLKPENVLLSHPAKSTIKVIDFGSSCLEHEKVYTYIQSRFYRSPEVILGMNYHMAIDMWSLGCILAELYTGFPIFPGENEQEQLSCIMEVLGAPEKELVNRSSRKRLFFDSTGAPRPVVNSKGRRRRPGAKTLAQVLRCDDDLFVDFVGKCLVWDPERRLKPQPAMRHPYMTAVRRSKAPITTPTSTTRALLNANSSVTSSTSKGKLVPDTPKKSQIGAPTPLTSRVTRASTTASTPGTPVSQAGVLSGTSSNRNNLRASQGSSTTYQSHTPRLLSGYVVS